MIGKKFSIIFPEIQSRLFVSLPFLNQSQGSSFTVRECAQSILRLEKPKNRRFSHKNPKMFDFRFNTPTPFPESGSRRRFHASGMRGIDFSHKITPRNVFFFRRSSRDCLSPFE